MYYIRTCLTTKYACFSGRARRAEFWTFWFFVQLVNFLFIFSILGMNLFYTGHVFLDFQRLPSSTIALFLVGWLFSVVVLIPFFAVLIQRLHDTNRSGWNMLLSCIPIVGLIILLIFLCADTAREPNRYGESPKYPLEK